MKSFILVFLALFSSGLIAQNKYFVGVGANASFYPTDYNHTSPAVYFHIQKNASVLHSFSISDVFAKKTSAAKNIDNVELRQQDYGIAYQYTHLFFKKSPIQPGIGGGLNLYYLYRNARPQVGNYPSTFQKGGITGQIVPSLKYTLKDKWMFLLQIPFSVMDYGLVSTQLENPSLPLIQQKNAYFNFNALPGTYAIQASISYRIK